MNTNLYEKQWDGGGVSNIRDKYITVAFNALHLLWLNEMKPQQIKIIRRSKLASLILVQLLLN
jgi:hypothetical protein